MADRAATRASVVRSLIAVNMQTASHCVERTIVDQSYSRTPISDAPGTPVVQRDPLNTSAVVKPVVGQSAYRLGRRETNFLSHSRLDPMYKAISPETRQIFPAFCTMRLRASPSTPSTDPEAPCERSWEALSIKLTIAVGQLGLLVGTPY